MARSLPSTAIRPLKGGRALLGRKLEAGVSGRLTAVVELEDLAAVDGEIARVFGAAAERG